MTEQFPISLRVSLDSEDAERAIVRFLKDYLSAAGRKRYVVGLSGGIDSAVSGALAVRAIGPDKVHPVVLPESSTPASDVEDGRLVARHLAVETITRSIQPFVEAFRAAFPDADRVQLANAKARFRMVLLHAEAARRDGLVLGTGNKSELLTGYFSKFGDGGVDVQPLGDLYKTQVRQLAHHLGLPPRVIEKPPTAGLWEGQTDEAELGLPYAVLDRLLLGLELRLRPDLIARIVGVPRAEVERIEALRARSQHKRRGPLSPKLNLRTVGLDWRSPVLEA